jgi:hypothetical protein
MLSSLQERLVHWLCRVYGLMLWAYPSDFRHDYGREMATLFRDRARNELAHDGRWALLPFMLQILWDWLQTVVRERTDAHTKLAAEVNGIAVISLFGANNVVRVPDTGGQSRALWLLLGSLGACLLVAGWLRWMTLMGLWR